MVGNCIICHNFSAVLFGGNIDSKAKAAFALYDYDGTSNISFNELVCFLKSIFVTMKHLHPELYVKGKCGIDQLAEITAKHAFKSEGLRTDDSMDFEQFRRWYSKPFPANPPEDEISNTSELPPSMSNLQIVQHLSGLFNFRVGEILELFAKRTDEIGFVSLTNFEKCVDNILEAAQDDIESISDARDIWDKLYDLFDPNGTEQVDFTELATGLSVLCGSPSDENVAAAFSLYDLDNRGVISFDDMVRYLTCVFRVFYSINPSLIQSLEATPEELAIATATKAFEDAGHELDGELTCDEFKEWYGSGGIELGYNVPLPGSKSDNMTIKDVQYLINLDNKSINDVFTALDSVSDDGMVVTFQEYRHGLLQLRETALSNTESSTFETVAQRLFTRFLNIQTDDSDPRTARILDICAGLSVLCSGDGFAKSLVAFELFDTNKDGRLSREEMTRYLTAVFSVMYELQPGNFVASLWRLLLSCWWLSSCRVVPVVN